MVLKVSLNTGINRIRLEFKGTTDSLTTSLSLVLIESDWNLKYPRPLSGQIGNGVLIESDWNLKYVWTIEIDLHSTVLIESDWNLK